MGAFDSKLAAVALFETLLRHHEVIVMLVLYPEGWEKVVPGDA